MSADEKSAKKKAAPFPLVAARAIGARIRPLAPVALPVGAAVLSVVAFAEAARPSSGAEPCDEPSCSAAHKQSLFDLGAERVRSVFDFALAIDPTTRGVRTAGAGAALAPTPFATTPPVAAQQVTSTNGAQSDPYVGYATSASPPHAHPPNIAGGIRAIEPPKPPVPPKGVSVTPNPHPPHLGGKPVAPSRAR